MPDPPPLIDVHCHMLPGVDDGAADWNESAAMARAAVADGISTVVVTPHQLGGDTQIRGDAIRAGTARLQRVLQEQSIPLRVVPGAEVRVVPDLAAGVAADDLLTLADRGRHVLLELPHDVYLPLDRLLYELRLAEITAILAHPERNAAVLARRHLLPSLVEAGCLLQITAGSLAGTFGPRVQKLAQWLVGQRLVHFVGTDSHGAKVRRPLLHRAFQCVAGLAGRETAVALCCDNPGRVVAGKTVAPLQRGPRKPGLTGWFRWNKAG